MAVRLGLHADRLASVRALRTVKGRRAQSRFAFEGETLLGEALQSDFPVEELYATQEAYDASPLARQLDAGGVPCFILEPASAGHVSDLATPSGIVAVSPVLLCPAGRLFAGDGLLLVLADVNDPANAGTLLRSADAFGCAGVVFGSLGVDPFHPKVVRGSMGAVFRLAIAVADPEEVAQAAGTRFALLGLAAGGSSLESERWERPVGAVVGNERHGLGRWERLCRRLVAIPMRGPSESLSAAVAGSIALYEASRRYAAER